jgi:hypothetical protein
MPETGLALPRSHFSPQTCKRLPSRVDPADSGCLNGERYSVEIQLAQLLAGVKVTGWIIAEKV